MAEAVGGALLSAFLSALFDNMSSKEFVDFFHGKKAIPKLLKELKIRLISADALLNDAEEKQLRDENVKNWLEELKDLIFDVDHVIDRINTEALRCEIEGLGQSEKVLNFLPFRSNWFDRGVKLELQKILSSLKLLLEQSDLLGLKKGVKRSSAVSRLLAPLVEESDVYGREAEKNALIELLISDDVALPKISVIPIVGMGGIGKTTLTQVVYNDARVQEHFDLKSWVTVSEEFDVPRLTKIIFEAITCRKCNTDNPHQVQRELKEALRGKKFLFVHDDVWNEEYELWDLLRSAFESGASGSKILVTTRSEIVASQMGNVEPCRLHGISENDCWVLFARHVFGSVDCDANPDLKEIGIQFVKKCKGLPLAVKSLAGLLRSMMSPDSWRAILESDIWGLEFRSSNILPTLWLSYSLLPKHLKRCFSFLSIFPKDSFYKEQDREKVVLMWMAEGLVESQNNRRAEDVGQEYMNALISRSLFQHSTWHEKVLVMHDLVHDLALFVSSRTRYCSLQETYRGLTELGDSIDTASLRALIVLPVLSFNAESRLAEEVLRKVFSRGGCLRSLSLSKSSIRELPDSIGNMKHLRYLDLSLTEIQELPESLCLLYNLQTLLLLGCKYLTHLPARLSRLINLRHLDIEGVNLLREMPPDMCNMRGLQILSSYVPSEKRSSRVKELGELQLLHGNFSLRRLQNIITVEDALGAKIKSKRYLAKVSFEWDNSVTGEDREMDTKILNALEPHSGIKEVEVIRFGGTKLPDWFGAEYFRDLVRVSLVRCKNCRWLPTFGQLPSLKKLDIQRMDEVETIWDEFVVTSHMKPFLSLEVLTLVQMSSWKKWSFIEGVSIFPSLKKVTIHGCGKLDSGLPIGSTLPVLEEISIEKCDAMQTVFPLGTDAPCLKSITVDGCGALELFSRTVLPSTLIAISVWECPRLMSNRIEWGLQTLSSLQTLTLKGDIEQDSFPEEGLLPSGLKELTLSHCEALKGLSGKGFKTLAALWGLYINECNELERLPEEVFPSSLKELWITKCPFLNEQCQRGTGKYWPKIQHIPRIYIDYQQI